MNDYIVTYDANIYDNDPRDGGWYEHKDQKCWADDEKLNHMLLDPNYKVRVILKVLEWRALNVEVLQTKAGLDKAEDDRLAKRDELQRKQIALDAEKRKAGLL